jgi:hypothetical protein
MELSVPQLVEPHHLGDICRECGCVQGLCSVFPTALTCFDKVSEYTSWSSAYYSRIVHEALKVTGHDPDLVQVRIQEKA